MLVRSRTNRVEERVCRAEKWRSGECSGPKLVRAKENSPRREPWGSREIHEAPARGERSRGRHLPPPTGGSCAHPSFPRLTPVGYFLSPFGLEMRAPMERFFADKS